MIFGIRGVCVFGVAVLCLSGCSLGPATIQTDRQRYNESVRQTWNEEFLLNMVRLRYRDPPQFDAITNILSSHSFSVGVNETQEFRSHKNPSFAELLATKTALNNGIFNSLGFGGNANMSESPTITYSPLEGAEFTRSLLAPIHLETLVLLASSGWDVDRIMRMAVQEMNHHENVVQLSGTMDRAPQFEQFTELARWMRGLQQRGWLELAYDDFERPLSDAVKAKELSATELMSAADKKYQFHDGDDNKMTLYGRDHAPVLRIAPGAWGSPCGATEASQALGLSPGLGNYRLVWGNETGQHKPGRAPGAELVVSTRSPLRVLIFASKGIEIPRKHLEKGLVVDPVDEHGQSFDWTRVTGDLIRVKSQKTRPLHSFAAVKYRGYWFYIDDQDLNSKSTFALVLEVFGLELAGGIIPGPVVTVPVGGGLQATTGPSGGGGAKGGGGKGGKGSGGGGSSGTGGGSGGG